MIKKVMLTAIAVLFLLSGVSFASDEVAAVDTKDAEKVVQTAQSTGEAPVAPETKVAEEATEEAAVIADATDATDAKKKEAAKE